MWITGSQAWFLPRSGRSDEWFYIGFGHFYFKEPEFHHNYYKASRIPWMLCQSALRNFWDAETADLVIGYFGIILFAFTAFLLARNYLPGVPAAFLGVIFALLPVNHGSGGWNYHNTLAGPLCLLALWATTRNPRKPADMIMTGAVWAALIHTNITYINFLFAIPLFLGFRKRFDDYLLMIVGCLLITTVFGLVAVYAGRDFDFWRLQFNLAREFVTDPTRQEAWYVPLSFKLLAKSEYLLFPGFALVACVASLLINRDKTYFKELQFHVFVVCLWFAWHLAGQTALNYEYFAFPLTQSAFLGILGILTSSHAFIKSKSAFILGFYITLSILAASFLTMKLFPGFNPSGKIIYSFLLLQGLLLAWGVSQKTNQYFLAIIIFLSFIGLSANKRNMYQRDSPSAAENKAKVEFIYALMDASKNELAGGSRTTLWYDEDESLFKDNKPILAKTIGNDFALSVACLGYGFLGRPPSTPIENMEWDNNYKKRFRNGKEKIIVLSNDRDKAERFLACLKKSIPEATIYWQNRISKNGYTIEMFKIGIMQK